MGVDAPAGVASILTYLEWQPDCERRSAAGLTIDEHQSMMVFDDDVVGNGQALACASADCLRGEERVEGSLPLTYCSGNGGTLGMDRVM
jgi:hypothetical protein